MDLESISVMSDAVLSDAYLKLYRELEKYIEDGGRILGSDAYRDYLLVGHCMIARGLCVRGTIEQLCLDVMKVLSDLRCVRVYRRGENKPMAEISDPEVISKFINNHPELLYGGHPGTSGTDGICSSDDIMLISGDGTSVRFSVFLMFDPWVSSVLFRAGEGQ